MAEKKTIYPSRLKFNNSTKLMAILPRKNSIQFISVGVRVVLKFLVLKTSGNIKICFEINL